MNPNTLKKEIDKAPHLPGIYLFSAKGGSLPAGRQAPGGKKPLYIGKALDLNKRLKNYLRTDDARIQKMVTESASLSFIKTDSEIEALILESQYIKKYMPDFNIMQRDDKQYGYVAFTDEKYPKIFITHQPTKNVLSIKYPVLREGEKSENRNTKYIIHNTEPIGPFTDIGALKTTLCLLRRIFPYCTCKQLHNNYCLNYHINKCIGDCCLKKPTTNNLQLTTYKNNIKAIKDILSGKRSSLIKNLEKEMRALSAKQEYEKAMELQFKIEKLKKVFENAQIIGNWSASWRMENGLSGQGNSNTDDGSSKALLDLKKLLNLKDVPHRIEGYDISNMQGTNATGSMVSFINGKPDKNTYRKFKIYTKDTPNDTAMLQEIIERRFRHTEWQYPDLVLIDGGKGQLNTVSKVLKKMKINIPIIGISKDEHHRGHQLLILKNAGWKIISLNKLSQSNKNLLLKIDEEAHRFAISYYRKIQRKKAFRPNY